MTQDRPGQEGGGWMGGGGEIIGFIAIQNTCQRTPPPPPFLPLGVGLWEEGRGGGRGGAEGRKGDGGGDGNGGRGGDGGEEGEAPAPAPRGGHDTTVEQVVNTWSQNLH